MARLLKGFTDLLQPINLLPDVLAGGGGYPLSGTFTASSGATFISKDIQIRTYNSNTTLTYTFSNRTLRIQGTVTPSSTTIAFVGFRGSEGNNLPLNELSTGIVTWTNNSSSEVTYSLSNSSGGRVAYYTYQKDNTAINIGCQTVSSSFLGFAIFAPLNKTVTVDVTINNVAVYEGAYTNPPFCKSIAQLSNEGLTGLLSNRNYSFKSLTSNTSSVDTAHRCRLFKIATSGTNNSFCYDFFLYKRITTTIHSACKVKCRMFTGVVASQYPPTIYNYYLKAEGYKDASNSSQRIKSFQITYDSDLNIYLCVTLEYTANSAFSIYSLGGFCTSPGNTNKELEDLYVYDGSTNTTDTVLYTTNVSYPTSGSDII